jgi:hypothetical protein
MIASAGFRAKRPASTPRRLGSALAHVNAQPNPCKALRRNIEILTAMLECLEDGEVVAFPDGRSGSLYRRRPTDVGLARAVRQVAQHEFANDRCGSACH